MMFTDIDKEFWAYGIGAMCWKELDGLRALYIILPGWEDEERPDTCPSALFVNHAPNNWAKPGEIEGWDGNIEKPTFTPSIHIPGGWHGYLTEGELTLSR